MSESGELPTQQSSNAPQLLIRDRAARRAAAAWWMVYAALVDLGRLVAIRRLTRREDVRYGP
jgi:hypothetical protein